MINEFTPGIDYPVLRVTADDVECIERAIDLLASRKMIYFCNALGDLDDDEFPPSLTLVEGLDEEFPFQRSLNKWREDRSLSREWYVVAAARMEMAKHALATAKRLRASTPSNDLFLFEKNPLERAKHIAHFAQSFHDSAWVEECMDALVEIIEDLQNANSKRQD